MVRITAAQLFGYFLVALISVRFVSGQEGELPEKNAEVLATAISQIDANYAQLSTIRAKLYTFYFDHKVEKRQQRTVELADGGSLTFTESPSEKIRSLFTSVGANYRVESLDPGRSIYICRGDLLTLHRPQTQETETKPLAAWGVGVLDPRSFGGIDLRRGLQEQLKASKATSVKKVENEVHLTTEVFAKGKSINRRSYALDRAKNWLPLRIVTWRDEGLVNDLTEFEYDEVLPNVWFMKRVTVKYAGFSKVSEMNSETQWSQSIITMTLGKPEFNVPISEEELTLLKAD